MCGRFGIVWESKLSKYYKIPVDLNIQTNYNIAPSLEVPVILMKDKTDMEYMQWGFIPFWANDKNIGYKMINARAEEVENKPAYKNSFINKRCLIPASFFYEWKREGKEKQPYLFKLKDRDVISFAGLWSIWVDENGAKKKTFTIITTEANDVVKPIHDRMPVILTPENEEKWIDNSIKDTETLKAMLKPYDAKSMVSYQVSKDVNSPKENNKNLIEEQNSK